MSKYTPKKYVNWDKCFSNEKYLYINIPKNASTTLRNLLNTKRNTFIFDDNKIIFTVIRNPLERIVSSFFECSKLRNDGPREITIKSEWYKNFNSNIIKSFELFVDFLSQKVDGEYYFYDAHTHPQYLYLDKKNIKLEDLDYVFLMENLDELFEKLKLKKVKTKQNENKNKPLAEKIRKHIQSNETLKNKINSLYKTDLKIYNKVKNKE